MKLAIPAANKRGAARCGCRAFTLAEVLAALLFLAIVVPTAVEALHVASLGGEVAVRKSAAQMTSGGLNWRALVPPQPSGPA